MFLINSFQPRPNEAQSNQDGIFGHSDVTRITVLRFYPWNHGWKGFGVNGIATITVWSASLNIDSSSFIAEKELIEALEKHSSTEVCDAKRRLYSPEAGPTGLYLLRNGRATLALESLPGKVLVTIRLHPGSLFGLSSLMQNEPSKLRATAEAGSELGFITPENLNELMRSDPSLAVGILRILAAEVRTVRHAIAKF